MKTVERILMKLIVIQFIFLFFSQLFLHHFKLFPELQKITVYEGVTNNSFTQIIETFNGKD